jgi:POT family proton-dependent oligopeptide transporter
MQGREPNDMPQAKRSALARWASIVGVAAAVLVILFGTGVIDVKASVFAENFAYFLTTIAGMYFLYLYAFAGLDAAERKNVLLLFLLFVAAAAFWSGFDQSGGSLNLFARDFHGLELSRLRHAGVLGAVFQPHLCGDLRADVCRVLGLAWAA